MEEVKKEQMPEADKKDVEENKGLTILSYIGLLCLIPLLLKKDSKFAKFHAKQGLVMCIGWVFVWIPFVGWLLWVLLLIMSVWGIINVVNGKMVSLPIVGELAKKINI